MGCFFAFQRAVAPCLNGCLCPTALFSSRLNCRSRGGAEICLVSKRVFIPDGTPVLVTEHYILTRRNMQILNIAVCSATSVESCLCLKAPRAFPRLNLKESEPFLLSKALILLCASRACYVDCGVYITVAIGLCFAHRSAPASRH